MDVVVRPIGVRGTEWDLADRLGRPLGKIWKASVFEIYPDPSSRLQGVESLHASLDEAMTAIARHMGGACQLERRERG
jgi:hypothetical protein